MAASTKGFKKGDLVTLIGDWDNNGSFFYVDAVVYSCGKKQLVLTHAKTGEELGRHFRPYDASSVLNRPVDKYLVNRGESTYPRLSEEEAVAICLRAGEWAVAKARAEYANIKVCNASNVGYCKAIDRSVAELHEPRAIRK